MGFWQNVWDFLGEVSNNVRNNEIYKSGFSDGYYAKPRDQIYIREDYYNAGYNDGKSARESGKTF
jgi:hypothetical protein